MPALAALASLSAAAEFASWRSESPVDTPLSTSAPKVMATAAAVSVPGTEVSRQNMATPLARPMSPIASTALNGNRRTRYGKDAPPMSAPIASAGP